MWTLYHKILHDKIFSQKTFFLGREWSKSKNVAIFSKKCEKHDFRNKNAQQIGENIFCQQQTLFLDRIHWFMHKKHV